MNNEFLSGKNETQEKPPEEASSSENRTEKIDKGAVFGTLMLVGIGAFAAKKFWDWKGEEVKKQASPMVDEAIGSVLGRAREKFLGAVDSAFGVEKPRSDSLSQRVGDPVDRSGEKKVFREAFSGLGIDVDNEVKGGKRSLPDNPFLGKLQRQEERFGALADEDPVFATEVRSLSLQGQEEIMSFVRNLDPDTRGKISLAFLSGSLEASEEAVADIREKGRPFEKISLDEARAEEIVDISKKLFQSGLNRPYGDQRSFNHHVIEAAKTKIDLRKSGGKDSYIDDLVYRLGHEGMAIGDDPDDLVVIKSALDSFVRDYPEEASKAGLIMKSEEEKENTEGDLEGEKISQTMKEEYKRLLRERYTVQKVTLKIMANFLRAKK